LHPIGSYCTDENKISLSVKAAKFLALSYHYLLFINDCGQRI